jgi:hypothetical protein
MWGGGGGCGAEEEEKEEELWFMKLFKLNMN